MPALLKQIKLTDEPSKKGVKGIFKIVVFIFVAIFILEIWMVNRLSTYGGKIEELKQAKAGLELENQILENSIAQNAALISLQEKASPLGFTTIKNIEYLKTSNNLASAQ